MIQNRDKEREYLVEKADDEELMGKVFLQCGVEDRCKNKDCLKCPRRERMSLSLTHAEKVVIEDFAMIDLKIMGETKPKELELMQKICYKIMRKIFREEREE